MSIGWIKTGLKIATFKQIKKFIIYLLLRLVLYDLYNDNVIRVSSKKLACKNLYLFSLIIWVARGLIEVIERSTCL